jgi:hypothetical protein
MDTNTSKSSPRPLDLRIHSYDVVMLLPQSTQSKRLRFGEFPQPLRSLMKLRPGLTCQIVGPKSLVGLSSFSGLPCAHLRRGIPASSLPLGAMKRSNGFANGSPAKKPKTKPRPVVPDYCDVEPRRDEAGAVIWPAPAKAIEEARNFIVTWYG